MRVFNVFNKLSSHDFGFFVDAAAAIRAMLLDAGDTGEPSPNVCAELADAEIVLDRLTAASIGFDLDGTGDLPAATLFVKARAEDGRPRLAFCANGDADLNHGESWNHVDLPDAQLAEDVANSLNAARNGGVL